MGEGGEGVFEVGLRGYLALHQLANNAAAGGDTLLAIFSLIHWRLKSELL